MAYRGDGGVLVWLAVKAAMAVLGPRRRGDHHLRCTDRHLGRALIASTPGRRFQFAMDLVFAAVMVVRRHVLTRLRQ